MGKKLTYEEVLKDVDLERPLPRSHNYHLFLEEYYSLFMNMNMGISARDAADALAATLRNISPPTA